MSGKNKSPKGMIIAVAVFLVVCVVGIIVSEISRTDRVYGDPYEVQAVITDMEADRKMHNTMDTNGVLKKRSDSSDYEYYIYAELENGEEASIRLILESEYNQYKVGQQVTVVCRDITENGKFIGVEYSIKK